jgi:3-oxoacyl-[acyl-carrier protein] reductase
MSLAGLGASVVVTGTGRDPDTFPPDEKAAGWKDVQSTAEHVRQLGPGALALVADVTDEQQVEQMMSRTLEEFGRVDILVNNAGVALHDRIPDIREEDFDRTYQVNTKGLFLCTQAVFSRMCEQGSGHIVNVSSTSGKQGSAGFGSYAASKFAAIGFTQATHAEGQPHGVKASVVCPGPVDTVMRRDNHPNDIIENLTQPEEIADAILHLVCQSPRAHTPEVIVGTPLNVSKR